MFEALWREWRMAIKGHITTRVPYLSRKSLRKMEVTVEKGDRDLRSGDGAKDRGKSARRHAQGTTFVSKFYVFRAACAFANCFRWVLGVLW